MEEIWKDIKGYEGFYQISNLGRVKSLISSTPDKEKIISIINGKKNGYCYAMLHKNGRNKNYLLHRLIAENFIPNIENKPCVDHINGKRDDNRIENLRWCTHKENNNFFLARKHNHEAQQLLLKNEEFVRRRAEASRQAMKREDVREKMRLIALQRIDKGEKGVCKYDLNGILISEYSSIANATRDTGISNSRIINCCKGRTKTAGGFQWKYKNDVVCQD